MWFNKSVREVAIAGVVFSDSRGRVERFLYHEKLVRISFVGGSIAARVLLLLCDTLEKYLNSGNCQYNILCEKE